MIDMLKMNIHLTLHGRQNYVSCNTDFQIGSCYTWFCVTEEQMSTKY